MKAGLGARAVCADRTESHWPLPKGNEAARLEVRELFIPINHGARNKTLTNITSGHPSLGEIPLLGSRDTASTTETIRTGKSITIVWPEAVRWEERCDNAV